MMGSSPVMNHEFHLLMIPTIEGFFIFNDKFNCQSPSDLIDFTYHLLLFFGFLKLIFTPMTFTNAQAQLM